MRNIEFEECHFTINQRKTILTEILAENYYKFHEKAKKTFTAITFSATFAGNSGVYFHPT